MSIASNKDIAKFATDNYVCETSRPSNELFLLANPESFCGNRNIEFEKCSTHGWSFLWNWRAGEWKCGLEKTIDAPAWKKDDFCVWIVNESPYESVGHYQITLVAKDEQSIRKFIEDFASEFSTNRKIVKNKSIINYY